MTKVWEVKADYRGKDYEPKATYYVVADSKGQARRKFMQRITWLTVYSVNPLPDEEGNNIREHPDKYIVW